MPAQVVERTPEPLPRDRRRGVPRRHLLPANGCRRRLWNVRQNHCLGTGGGVYLDVTSSPESSSRRIWACTEEEDMMLW